MTDPNNGGIHYAFAIFNSLQGFFILVFGTLLDKKVRSELTIKSQTSQSRTTSTSAGFSFSNLRIFRNWQRGRGSSSSLNVSSNSLDELLSKVKDTFGLKTNVRLQYMDKEFGNDFFNLSSTSDLEDLGTVKINAEFQRLMALPLEQTFLAQLDRHSSQLIKVIQAKGGATRAKMAGIMRTYDEVWISSIWTQ
ncbi:unnamed protein product [Menidia menidia]|uniref:(Atlantic silverside) hypothetical protein n=1 Tax=Menidia menidia TaxID=238744 RepID=A0A8S4B7X6_9TELE|nr:unnamed protein product [Menidia menidia]